MIIIGGGISGLAAAQQLERNGIDWLLLEASDRPGGRIRTDRIAGGLIDRGFQVLNDGYPALQGLVDLPSLQLGSFLPGARIASGGRTLEFNDPRRKPVSLLRGLRHSPASSRDLAALARLGLADAGADNTTLALPCRQALQELGFSPGFIADFLLPFFRAVFLNQEMDIEWRHMRELMMMFSRGMATLPSGGMQAFPTQLADSLQQDRIHCNMRVESVGRGSVDIADAEAASCSLAIVATQPSAAASLLGLAGLPEMMAVRSLHFASDQAPTADAMLYLPHSSERGPVCNLAIPSNLHDSYSFGGRPQVLASSLDMDSPLPELEAGIRSQLAGWFSNRVHDWELVHVNEVHEALPRPSLPGSLPTNEAMIEERAVLLCGDYPGTPSINRALESGIAAGNLAARLVRSSQGG